MNCDDIHYFEARAEQELGLAQPAEHPSAVHAHFVLASHYLDLVHESPHAPEKPRAPWQ